MNHWDNRNDWSLVGEPLKPSRQDLKFLIDFSAFHLERTDLLILGATHNYIKAQWPRLSSLTCVDASKSMLASLPQVEGYDYVLDNWFNISKYNNINYIIGDGIFTVTVAHQLLIEKLALISKKDTVVAFRLFLPSNRSPMDVMDMFKYGEYSNFHHFKLELMSSLIDCNNILLLHKVWNVWDNNIKTFDIERLFKTLGWDINLIKTMDIFKNNYSYYNFPLLNEIIQLFSKDFKLLECCIPTYNYGYNCPTLFFQRK